MQTWVSFRQAFICECWESLCQCEWVMGRGFQVAKTICQSVAWFTWYMYDVEKRHGWSVGSLKLRIISYSAKSRSAFGLARTRVVLDSWVVSQIWLDCDSNESSQSRVGRENPGCESSQSRITLIVIWVSVESTGYCLSQSWATDFSKRKRQDLAIICNFTEKEPTYSYIRPHPPPRLTTFFPKLGKMWWVFFPKLGKMWWVMSQIWFNSDSNELSQSWVRLEI